MKLRQSLLYILLLISGLTTYAQKHGQARLDSLVAQVPKQREDSNAVKLYNGISFSYSRIEPSTGIPYAKKALELAQKIDWEKGHSFIVQ